MSINVIAFPTTREDPIPLAAELLTLMRSTPHTSDEQLSLVRRIMLAMEYDPDGKCPDCGRPLDLDLLRFLMEQLDRFEGPADLLWAVDAPGDEHEGVH